MDAHKPLIVGQHYPAIDGLRGMAFLLVLWFHSSYFVTIGLEQQLVGATYSYYLLTMLGETGVDLFFVLSGFLITGILMDTAQDPRPLRNFYIRRSLRIFPLYYAVLFVFLAYFFFVFGIDGLDHGKVWTHLFYLQNWSFSHNLDQFILLDHTWSLAAEEQFYLIWPLVFLSFYKGRMRGVFLLCAFMIVLSWGLRIVFTDLSQYKWAYTFTISRLDSLALGALLSVLCARYRDKIKEYHRFLPYVMCAVFAVILIILFAQDTKVESQNAMIRYGLTLFSILYVSLLAYVFLSKDDHIVKRFFSCRALREVGRVSYGMYLFHSPIMMILVRQLYQYDLGYWKVHGILLCLGFALSFAAALLSYRFLEKPILRLKDKYAPQ
tara:strand:- start:51230 stop:52369 length:1140 start_codon:yes stop_codon:yes gene_type:complete